MLNCHYCCSMDLRYLSKTQIQLKQARRELSHVLDLFVWGSSFINYIFGFVLLSIDGAMYSATKCLQNLHKFLKHSRFSISFDTSNFQNNLWFSLGCTNTLKRVCHQNISRYRAAKYKQVNTSKHGQNCMKTLLFASIDSGNFVKPYLEC